MDDDLTHDLATAILWVAVFFAVCGAAAAVFLP
jgi:hypothetical protein